MNDYDPTAYREFFEREFTYLAGFRRNIRRYAGKTRYSARQAALNGTMPNWGSALIGWRRDLPMLECVLAM